MTLGYVLSLCCNLNESAFSGISLPSQTAYSRVQAKMECKYPASTVESRMKVRWFGEPAQNAGCN